MKYIPATIPDDLACTRTGLLWAAANIAVDEPAIDDAISEAASRSGVKGGIEHVDSAAFAVKIAQSRVPTAKLNPMWPTSQWSTWQDALEETWPILADAAARMQDDADVRIGLVPGRWEA